MAAPSTWLIVFALGLMGVAVELEAAALLTPATLFLRRFWAGVAPLADSRRLRGREDGVEVW